MFESSGVCVCGWGSKSGMVTLLLVVAVLGVVAAVPAGALLSEVVVVAVLEILMLK